MLFKDNVQFNPHVTQEGGGSGIGLWSELQCIFLNIDVVVIFTICSAHNEFLALQYVILAVCVVVFQLRSFEWYCEAA